MVVSDPPNVEDLKDVAWASWLAELRDYLVSLGLDIPPARFGAGVTSQSWVEYAAKIASNIDGAPPVPLGISLRDPVWRIWYTSVANILNQ